MMKKRTMSRTTTPKTTDDPSNSASPHAHAPDLFLLSFVHDVTTALISARICYPSLISSPCETRRVLVRGPYLSISRTSLYWGWMVEVEFMILISTGWMAA